MSKAEEDDVTPASVPTPAPGSFLAPASVPTPAPGSFLAPASVPTPAPGSFLARLRAQRERSVEHHREFHLQIPGTDDLPIFAVYRPADPGVIEEAVDRRRKKAKSDEAKKLMAVLANADVLVEHCTGIYALDDGKERGLDDDAPDAWTRYDHRLAAVLGIEQTNAAATCRAMFPTDGHLVTHAAKLAELSGFAIGDVEERIKGE